nr:CST complex subunit TEN1 [Tanacetum cinerariifolium]
MSLGWKKGILKARVGRNVDGMNLNLYEQSWKLILFVLHPAMMVCVMIDIPFRVDSVSKKAVMLYACLSPSHKSKITISMQPMGNEY